MTRPAIRIVFSLTVLLVLFASPAFAGCDNFQINVDTITRKVTFSWSPNNCLQYAWSFRGQNQIDCCGHPPPRTWSINLNCMTGPEELVAQDASPYSGNPTLGRVTIAPQGAPQLTPKMVPPPAGFSRGVLLDYDFRYATGVSPITIDLLPTRFRPASRAWTSGIAYSGQGSVTAGFNGYGPALIRWTACGIAHEVRLDLGPPDCSGCKANQCPDCVGEPVATATGNMRLSDLDPIPAAGGILPLQRTYDSSSASSGWFGLGWSSFLDAAIRRSSRGTDLGGYMSVVDESGTWTAFSRASSTAPYTITLPASSSTDASLTASGTDWIYRDPGGRIERTFDATGKVTQYKDVVTQRTITIAYDANALPMSVTDSWNVVNWTILTDSASRTITSISVDGQSGLTWTYTYSGAVLASVTSPLGTWRTYEGTTANGVWRLTTSRDGAGHMIESHVYDAAGWAVTSSGPTAEITGIGYWTAGRVPGEYATTVTHPTGAIETHYLRTIGGRQRTVQITGGCLSCGSHDMTVVYDASGNVTRQQHADGYITEIAYDATSRPTQRTEHLRPSNCDPATDPAHCRMDPDSLLAATTTTTAATLTSTYAYADTTWTQRPTTMTTSSVFGGTKVRTETIAYDAASGVVLSRSVDGWTGTGTPFEETHTTTTALYDGTEYAGFTPGGPFDTAWLTLPQPRSVIKSIDGPRTAVNDIAKFVYYPVDSSVPATYRGRLAAVQNAAGHITTIANYDVFGNAGRTVDANGVATETTYDALGRALTTTLKGVSGCNAAVDPLCATDLTASRAYSAAGPLLSQTDANGNVISYEYDSRGRLTAHSRGPSTSSLKERIEQTWDASTGRKSMERYLAMENGAWVEKHRESFAYDALAQLTAQIHADDTSVAYTYDESGSILSVRDENHATANTHYEYDPARRLASVEQTLGSGTVTTSYAYDIAGNLSSVTDPNGNATTYTYDDFGQMIGQTSPVTGTTTYQYGKSGTLQTVTDANGAVAACTYDALDRVIDATFSCDGQTSETVTWTYDTAAFGLGRLAQMTDPSGVTAYAYDRRGLLLSESRASGLVVLTSAFQYDAGGNRTLIRYPSGLEAVYTFDYANRPLSASWGGITRVSGAAYLPYGPETSLTFANSTTQTRTYDARYRIQRNVLTGAAGAIADYTYSEDAAGNIASIHDMLDPAYNRDFGYDDLSRLTTANSGASLWGSGSFRYDAMGNLLARDLGGVVEVDPNDPFSRTGRFSARPESLPAPGSIHETYAYSGTTSKLITMTSDGLDHPITYDSAGNEIRYYDTRTYSPRNLMSSITEPSEDSLSHTINYGYDGRGVRVLRSEGTSGYTPFANRYYVYSPELLLLAMSVDDNPNIWGKTAITHSVPAMKHEILWFNGRPVAHLADGATIRYTFTDHLGTPILQTDPAASIVWRAEYEPYGDLWSLRAGTAAEQPLRFPGQEYAGKWEGVEEHYNIFRWYRAGWGRYTQADPLAFMTTGVEERVRISTLAAYSYAMNSPISYDDPLGLYCRSRTIYGLRDTYKRTKSWTAWTNTRNTTELPHDPESDINQENADSAAFAGGYASGPEPSGQDVGFGIIPWSPEKCIWRRYLIGAELWRQKQSIEVTCTCPPRRELIPLGYRFGSNRRVLQRQTTYTDGMSHIFGIWNIECPEPQD